MFSWLSLYSVFFLRFCLARSQRVGPGRGLEIGHSLWPFFIRS